MRENGLSSFETRPEGKAAPQAITAKPPLRRDEGKRFAGF
jgi:hypothetical protein